MVFVSQFYELEGYTDGFVKRAKQFDLDSYDHILFSYHGLPIRQLDKVYDEGLCDDRNCEHGVTGENQYCYKAACYESTKMIAQKLGLSEDRYTTSFQSRLDDKWIKPYSDKVVAEKAKTGAKRMLIF